MASTDSTTSQDGQGAQDMSGLEHIVTMFPVDVAAHFVLADEQRTRDFAEWARQTAGLPDEITSERVTGLLRDATGELDTEMLLAALVLSGGDQPA